MPDYQKTKIYKIWSPNSEKVYVGATTQTLAQRMGKHRKLTSNLSSKIIIDLGDAKIELIQEFPCNNKMESDKKEGEYIRSLNCVNKQIAGRSMKEYRNDNRDKLNAEAKVYNINNKVKVSKKKQEYRKNNVKKVKEQEKLIRESNKEKLAINRKAYREANGEKIRAQERASYAIRIAKAKLATIDELN